MNSLTSISKASMSEKHTMWSTEGSKVEVLTDIYQKETNIVIWQRTLAKILTKAAESILDLNPTLKLSMVVHFQDNGLSLKKALGSSEVATILSKDITKLIEMFCYLFDLKKAGLRLTSLDNAMCPRFHVDRVPCRLLTTYYGEATQWIPHLFADRSKLGWGNHDKPDEQSGLINSVNKIQQMNMGEVALLKGEAWEGNQGAGLIHRSPPLENPNKRLLMTLDFIND